MLVSYMLAHKYTKNFLNNIVTSDWHIQSDHKASFVTYFY